MAEQGRMLVLDLVVGSFLRDDNVVDVAFTQAAGGDLHHAGFFVEVVHVIIETFLNLRNGETVDFDEMSEALFIWAKKWLNKE